MVYNTLIRKMATNFDKSRDLKTLASNLHGEEFLKTICISVMRRATKFFLCIIRVWSFCSIRVYVYFLPIFLVKLDFCLSVFLYLLFLNFSFSFLFWIQCHFKRFNDICIIREYDLVHFNFVLTLYKRSVKTRMVL